MATFDDLRMYARFPFALKKFLRHVPTLADAQRIVRERIEWRADIFLSMVEQCIYAHPRSPYLPLLQMAGCEPGDLAALVHSKGVEGALADLRAAGVYFTIEELKGQTPVTRDGRTLTVAPQDFDNPLSSGAFAVESGGSTGAGLRIAYNLDQLAARAPYQLLTFAAHNVMDAPQVFWRGILPENTLSGILERAYVRKPPTLWFSQIAPRESKHWPEHTFATYYIVAWARLLGQSIPFPRYAPVARADIVARAIAELLKQHGRCLMITRVSHALRACLAAEEAGLDLTGLLVFAGGEPVTQAKIDAIERSGAAYRANYAMTEAGLIAQGCANPLDPSDVHLFRDAYAVTTHPHTVEGFDVTVPAFHLTSLLPTSPKVLLNIQMDDCGIVEERACGCGHEHVGFTTHLREIRSYRKLTGEGITLVDNALARILEETLPVRFGGGPLDYQLLEQEEQGARRLYLVIHPRLDIADEQAVVEVVVDALRQSPSQNEATRRLMQQADALKVKRIEPRATARGKMMALYVERSR